MAVNLRINSKLKRFMTVHKPFKIIYGGRGSGKSIGVSDIMALKMASEAANIMCLREFQASIDDSVHSVLKESVTERLCLSNWNIQERQIIAPNGARTKYIGAARNATGLQSLHNFKYGWYEEAQRASQLSLDTLLPTILRIPGAECWFTANPQSSGDPFSQKFIMPFHKELERDGFYEDDMHMIIKLNWRDNPWWNETQNALRLHDKATMTRAKYDHIWEGAFNDSVENSIILPEWFDAAKDLHLNPKFKEAFVPHGAIIAAHDPFDDGDDAGGYACRHGNIITRVDSKRSGLIDEVCDWATDHAINDKADWFVWDGDGMGAGLRRQVSTAFEGKPTKFHMFKGSLSGSGQDNAELPYMAIEDEDQSRDKPRKYKEVFKNNRAQFYINLADRFENAYKALEQGKYIDPDEMISLNCAGIDDITGLRSQICRIPRKPNGQGLEQIMSKVDMKKLGIDSPNESDSVMMSLFAPPIQKKKAKKLQSRGWKK